MKDYSKHYFRLLQGMALSVSDYIRNQKPIVIIVFLLVHSISIYAQDNTISGLVKDNEGEPLPGVSVAVKAGESTDALFNNVKVNAQITEEWSTLAKTTTVYKCDADGNKLDVINVETEKYDPTVIYKDQDGNIVDAGTLPTFNIKVTGFAVQASTFNTYKDAQPELIELVNTKTSQDAQFN